MLTKLSYVFEMAKLVREGYVDRKSAMEKSVSPNTKARSK